MKKNSKFFADIEMKKPQQKPRYVNIYRHLYTNTHTHIDFCCIIIHILHICVLYYHIKTH